MIHPRVRTLMLQRLGLGENYGPVVDLIYGDCIELGGEAIKALEALPRSISLADLQIAYAQAEAELRIAKELHHCRNKGENTMSFKLHHTPPRTCVVKEVDANFFGANGIQLTELASDENLALAVPPAFSLKSGMSNAKDQGPAGHCTSFAVMGCLDYCHGKRDLSESCLTHEAEKRHGDCKEGLALAHAFDISTNPGAVDQTEWPNDPRQTCWTNPPNMAGKTRYRFNANRLVFYRPAAAVLNVMREQLLHGISNPFADQTSAYSRAVFDRPGFPQPQNFVRLLKAALANAKTPVAIAIPVWWASDGHFNAGWEDGPDIHMPTPVNLQLFLENSNPPNVSGWHAVAVCGYDDAKGRFEFKNSWHSWWGDNGFGTLPYSYITAYAREGMHGWV